MSVEEAGPWIPYNFLALTLEQSALETAAAVLIPVPYDSTTSYRTGARYGPAAILSASYNLEDYDHELDIDLSDAGIHTTAALEPHMAGPDAMVERVAQAVESYDDGQRLIGLLGGEHTIAIGAVRAMKKRRPNLSVLYLDAHGDLRDTYMDTPYSHACVARRLVEICPVVQVGVRSLSREEFLLTQNPPPNLHTFLWDAQTPQLPDVQDILSHLTEEIYVSIDLDAFDPSVMSAVGTPEPGGMDWGHLMRLIDAVARNRRIVGFDVVELSPNEGSHACAYTAAKLTYKLIATILSHNPRTLSQHANAIRQTPTPTNSSPPSFSREGGNPSPSLPTPSTTSQPSPPLRHSRPSFSSFLRKQEPTAAGRKGTPPPTPQPHHKPQSLFLSSSFFPPTHSSFRRKPESIPSSHLPLPHSQLSFSRESGNPSSPFLPLLPSWGKAVRDVTPHVRRQHLPWPNLRHPHHHQLQLVHHPSPRHLPPRQPHGRPLPLLVVGGAVADRRRRLHPLLRLRSHPRTFP